uniref:ANK_REP_REGION domain-containing protein n=1 Tax=Macrostomum lignano TaxID=282301 RepID=A0A1I8HPX9_9PLAT
MLAADAGQHRLIQHLLEIEVSLDSVTDDDGRTALTRACMTGQVRAAKVLLDHGANALHKDKDTSIQLAEKFGHYQIVRLLDGLEADASKSIALHKLLKEAGFTWQRAKLQQKMADSMEDIVRQIHENNEGIHVVGSFAEGWGSSLTQLNGQASDDCDINWTCLVGPREPVHLLNGCSCKAVKKTRFEVKQGYVQVDAMIGSEPAMTAAECGSKPAESFCFANPCCSNSIAEQTVMRGCFEANALPLHLVRAARPTADHELRISFSFLEKAIMRSLTDCQGQLYILMKFVLNRLVSGQVATAGLKTYHAKTLLLYLLHEHGFDEQIWRPDNLIRLLNESLDKLLEFIDSGPDPDICMPSFFLPDSPLYFANAGVGGDFQQTKSRVRDQLKRLRTTNLAEAVVQKLQHQLKPLQNENFYFHPFTMVPLQALNPLQTEGNSEITVSTFGKLYDVVRSYFELFSDKAGDAMALLKPLENLTWCKTTAACLNILLLYKVEDFEAAKKVLKGLDNHTDRKLSSVRELLLPRVEPEEPSC